MTSEFRFRAGDVVVVPFPYSDRLAEKRRPALVVSTDRTHAAGYVWLVMITSDQRRSLAGDRLIADLAAAGLPGPSVIRPVKIANVEPSRIVAKSGSLGSSDWQAVRTALADLIAL